MAATDRNVGHISTLTSEERNFIVQVLRSVKLHGNPAALRQALMLIDSINGKLAEELEEADKTRNPHFLP